MKKNTIREKTTQMPLQVSKGICVGVLSIALGCTSPDTHKTQQTEKITNTTAPIQTELADDIATIPNVASTIDAIRGELEKSCYIGEMYQGKSPYIVYLIPQLHGNNVIDVSKGKQEMNTNRKELVVLCQDAIGRTLTTLKNANLSHANFQESEIYTGTEYTADKMTTVRLSAEKHGGSNAVYQLEKQNPDDRKTYGIEDRKNFLTNGLAKPIANIFGEQLKQYSMTSEDLYAICLGNEELIYDHFKEKNQDMFAMITREEFSLIYEDILYGLVTLNGTEKKEFWDNKLYYERNTIAIANMIRTLKSEKYSGGALIFGDNHIASSDITQKNGFDIVIGNTSFSDIKEKCINKCNQYN